MNVNELDIKDIVMSTAGYVAADFQALISKACELAISEFLIDKENESIESNLLLQ